MDRKKSFYTIADISCFVIGCIYVLLSRIINKGVFGELRANVGIEVIAYKFPQTGSNLHEDKLSKLIVYLYAHAFAVLFVAAGLMLLLRLADYFIENSKERIKIIGFCIMGVAFVFVAYCVYPIPIGGSLDTMENFVFAKAWLPRYWHGFLTNIIYCAEMIVIPHPISMVIIPAIISFGLILYTLYRIFVKRTKQGSLWSILLAASLWFMFPTLETLFFAGRNFMYGIALFAVFSVLLADKLDNRQLTWRKAIWIAIFGAAVITWRGEGIIWILFIPLMILAAYYKSGTPKKVYLFVYLALFITFIFLWLPAKYGADKYQGKDYFIINMGKPLGAVLNSPDANLDYPGADNDLENVDKVVPIDWIKAFGGQSFQRWNAYNLRITCQGGPDNDGDAFIKSSYRILLHNPVIWVKERLDTVAEALNIPLPFNIPTNSGEGLSYPPNEKSGEFLLQWHEYRVIGNDYIANGCSIARGPITSRINYGFQLLMVYGRYYYGYLVIVANIAIIAMVIRALNKKDWLFVSGGLALLGSVCAIILASPLAYANYYFYSFFNEYWLLLIYVVYRVSKRKAKAADN